MKFLPSMYMYLYRIIIEEIKKIKLIKSKETQSINTINSILIEFILIIIHSHITP